MTVTFLFFILLFGVSNTMVCTSGDSGYPCCIFGLRNKTFWVFHSAFYQVEDVPSKEILKYRYECKCYISFQYLNK